MIHLFPYWISFFISSAVAIYTWQQRRITGALSFAGLAGAQAGWTLFYAFELASPELAQKLLWDNVQWVCSLLAPIMLLQFVTVYLQVRLPRPRLVWGLLLLPGIIFVLLAFTNDLHGLTHFDIHLEPNEPFDILLYDYPPLTAIIIAYVYVLGVLSIFYLIKSLFHSQGIQRIQRLTILIGVLIPIVGDLGALVFGIRLAGQRDLTPLTFALGNVVIAWGLFRYRLFDLVPIARDMVLDNMDDGVVVTDLSHRVVDMNRLARSKAMVNNPIGQPLERVYPVWKTDIERLRSYERVHDEIHTTIDGVDIHVDIRISPIIDRNGNPVGRLIITHDITERVRAQQAAEQHRLELALERERTRVLTDFVQHAAHEFRTPLSTINTSVYLLTRVTAPEQKQHQIESIETSIRHVTSLLDKMLDMMRLDQATTITEGQVDVNFLLQSIVDAHAKDIARKNHTIEQRLADDLPRIPGDEHKLHLAFSNIFENAVRFMPDGGCITIASSSGNPYISITIKDTGIGMSQEVHDHMFERFYRADTAHSTHGFGLGLSIAKRVVELHRGRITVDSAPDQGSTFIVSLPMI